MKRQALLFILLIFSSFATFSQRSQLLNDAEYFYMTKDYEEAVYLYLQLLESNPENYNFNFKTGMSYLNIPGQETKAIPYLKKATEHTILDYKEGRTNLTVAPHEAWFYLGNAYRINNQLTEALEAYDTFKNILLEENEYEYYIKKIVDKEVEACERAKIIQDNPLNFVKTNMGNTINAGVKTYQPVVSESEDAMVFMQEQKFYDAIMYTWKENGEWVVPQNITPQVGSDGDMIPAALSDDGQKLLLIKSSRNDEGDIYISQKEEKFWSKAVKLENINSPYYEGHASFANDGYSIVFSSARRGGFGGLDIYITHKLSETEWSEPENMGPAINTEFDEMTAFLVNNNSTLFFTSKGHFNMGGYDIFFSDKDKSGNWSTAANLGYPLNTTNDNQYFQPLKDGKTAYIALFNQEENFGEEDIYRIEILAFTDPLAPANSMFPEDFSLILEDEKTGEKIEINYSRKNDDIKIISDQKKKYKWSIKKR